MQAKREQAADLMEQLKDKATFDLPESVVTEETQNVIYQMIEENQRRGVPSAEMEKAKDEILSNATTSAKDKVKVGFILEKIAEAEKIEVTPEEMQAELEHMAEHYKMTVKKLIEKLNENYALNKVEKDIIQRKTIEHLITSKSK
jgi:trigger factor